MRCFIAAMTSGQFSGKSRLSIARRRTVQVAIRPGEPGKSRLGSRSLLPDGVNWFVKAGNDSSQFRASMEQVRSGSTDAVWRLIEDYGPHIQRVVRRRLDSRMRSKFDSQDFVQMVWASFFRNPAEMSSFDEPEDLMRYLSAMARHKVVNEYRRRILQQKHNVTREKPLSETHSTDEVVRTRDPTPSQFAIIREDWNRKLERMSDTHRKVVRLRLAGVTYTEIGRQLGMHERTAREIVHRVFDD